MVLGSTTQKQTMDPALRRTLPSELPLNLIQHIFFHLPFPRIICLRVLSMEWDEHVIKRSLALQIYAKNLLALNYLGC
jgi:hypothetical protein